jgi:protease I
MRIACVLANGFEDTEFKKPYDAYRAAGHDVTIIGLRPGDKLEGKRGKEKTQTEKGVGDVDASEFDALFIPGGESPDHLRVDDRMVRFVGEFEDKPIFAICHGPQLLISADMVRGREMTAWKTVQVDLRNAGADVIDEEVVIDGNLVTSRKPEDAEAFIRESLALLDSGAEASI